ncbi:MAG: hypothetical protein NTW04_04230, partial [Elusimicrobia bacterium]|nr:hypothetical protein [Elusimicrobiota bacterium]
RLQFVKTAARRLNHADIKILGVAVNMAKLRGISYSYYGNYYYKYRYSHEDESLAKDVVKG